MKPYILIAAMLGAGGAVWWVMELRATNADQSNQIKSLTLQLDGCAARSENIIEDKESDDAIDNLSDDDLRNVPADWMLPPVGGDGSLY